MNKVHVTVTIISIYFINWGIEGENENRPLYEYSLFSCPNSQLYFMEKENNDK